MRICICTGNFPARSETFVTAHVVGFARRSHHVSVVSQGRGSGIQDDELREVDSLGVSRVKVPHLGDSQMGRVMRMLAIGLRCPSMLRCWNPQGPWTRRELFEAWNYSRCLAAEDSDLVHVHYGAKAGPLHAVGGLPNRSVVTWHGYDANEKPRVRGDDMYHEFFKGDYFHTVGSAFMKRRLLDLGAREDAVSVIPMGIDLERFRPPALPRGASSNLRIVSVGRLHEMKGHRNLIAAVGGLHREGIGVQLRIVGEGVERVALERQIQELGLSEVVELAGALPSREVLDELYQADLFALTGVVAESGRVETQGVVFAEAQATGLPVVACDVGGASESLIDGKTGILCPPEDERAIMRAILHFVEHPEDLKAWGEAGRRFVEERFSVTKMLDSFAELYQSARASESSRGSC